MVNQVVDRFTVENLIPATSLQSLIKGYILSCKSEGKSLKAIATYQNVLKNFICYCELKNFPEAHQLTAVHIRHFLWYPPRELSVFASSSSVI